MQTWLASEVSELKRRIETGESVPQIAAHFRRSVGSVRKKVYTIQPNRPVKEPAYLPFLGKLPDTAIAEEYGVHYSTVRHHRVVRHIPAFDPERLRDQILALLPTHTDREIANQLGCSQNWAQKLRAKPEKPPGRVLKTPDSYPFHSLLGQKSDLEIAQAYNVSRGLVWQLRTKAGIPAHRKQAN